MCQPLRLFEISPLFEITSGMFQSSVLDSNYHSFVFTYRFCLSVSELIFLKELAEFLKKFDISVFLYDVSLNELETIDISKNYGDKNGLIFVKDRVKPFVLNLESAINQINLEDKRKQFVDSLKNMILKTLRKHSKTEEF